MALTKNDALDRAKAIWGDGFKTATVEISESGGASIETRLFYHILDANGHPTCHDRCKKLETAAYERKLLK